MKKFVLLMLYFISTLVFAKQNLPSEFVYLRAIDPSIQQEMRYAGWHNFIGHPIQGYAAAECILTYPAAMALQGVQRELKKMHLALKVYDCYRPQMAVNEFIVWSKQTLQQQMKTEFYPRVDKADFFKLGYVAEHSGHTRGSTVDLTLVPLPTPRQMSYHKNQRLVACFSKQRFPDNSIEMGTGYDCMDTLAHSYNKQVSVIAYYHRQLLRGMMRKYGFVPYNEEWWHFTLKNEPFPRQYFNFWVR